MTFEHVALGKTELKAARIGVAGGYPVSGKAIAWAVENGINYIFWGMVKFRNVPKALKLLGKNKHKAIVAVPCYGHKLIPLPRWAELTANRALKVLKRDYLDIFQIAWITRWPSDSLMEVLLKLKDQGKIRHLGITTHDRKLAAELLKDKNLEFFNIRYNAANRGAEKELFPYVEGDEKVLVNFNSTRWRQLLKPVSGWPENKPVPKAVDCYRFVLSRPEITLCLTGVMNLKQLKENLQALELGPMDEGELNWMKEFWHSLATEKSFKLLQTLRKKYSFILIGGWAVFFYTKALKSKDVDLIVEYEVLSRLKKDFLVTKNERLKKYEIKQDEVDVDIYLPYYSNPGLPAEGVKDYTTSREGFIIPLPEILLILKQKAYQERKDSPKGEKDKIDIFSLLSKAVLDWKRYRKVLKEYRQEKFKDDLSYLLRTTYEVREIGLNRQKITELKKEILQKL